VAPAFGKRASVSEPGVSTPRATDLQRRRVFVTGAAQGIGRGIVDHLIARGFAVVAADVDADRLDSLAHELVEFSESGRLATRLLDVRDDASVESAGADLGTADVLVNNAGLQFVSPLEEFPPQMWQQIIDVMLVGSARLIRAVLPGMRRRRYGRIVNIGSVHSLVASPYKSAYVAAKHGLLGLSKAVALETGDTDITINTICPAYVRTALVEKQIAEQARAHGIPQEEVIGRIMLAPMPKGRFIEIEEICGALEFLASDVARNITGQCMVIDGGWVCR
jgi:3-hydroxybutyrate dehydrogenase